MSKKTWFLFLFICGVFLGVNHLLNRDPSSDADVAPSQGRGLAGEDPKAQVVQKMADFVESRPQAVLPDLSASGSPPRQNGNTPEVAGYPLNRATADNLETRDGLGQFHLDSSEDVSESIQQVHHAWGEVGEADFEQRRALLGMTRGLAGVSDDPSLRETMLREYDSYQAQGNPNRNPDYAGQALQDYLNHETDEERKMEELKKRGIPMYRMPASTEEPVEQ